jgi:hypothetical protein
MKILVNSAFPAPCIEVIIIHVNVIKITVIIPVIIAEGSPAALPAWRLSWQIINDIRRRPMELTGGLCGWILPASIGCASMIFIPAFAVMGYFTFTADNHVIRRFYRSLAEWTVLTYVIVSHQVLS